MKPIFSILVALALCLPSLADAQRKNRKKAEPKPAEVSLDAFSFRNVGPAFLSGRIADIAVHPNNESVWYVAVGSGGVWKTENAGTTWSPIFDDQSTYTTGCVAIDPSNPEIVWVGSGENVGGDMLLMVMEFTGV